MAFDSNHNVSDARPAASEVHQLSPLNLDNAVRPIVDKRAMELPKDFAPTGKDLEIVDKSLAHTMKVAESMLTREQIDRVNAQADMPFKYIKMAPHRAQAGDTYWGIASDVVSQRAGRPASKSEVTAMMQEMATLNGKTVEQASQLKVGEMIKIPPAHKQA